MRDDNGRHPSVGRRGFLVGTAVTGLLAGCGDGGEEADPAPTTASGSAPPSGSGSAGTVLGPATDVPVNGGKIYEALEVVVTQPAAGEFRGFSAVCTHTGCIVNKVAEGTIDCPCHGSRFGLDGTVRNGPAPRELTSRPVRVEGGQIVLT